MSSVCGTFHLNKNYYSAEKNNISHILLASLIKAKNQTLHLASLASVSPIIRLVVYQPTQTLPDGALDTCPGWALKSLCSSYVGPVQTGVGDLVLDLWVGSYPFFRTRHHHWEWGLLWLKLDNVELLPVSQHLVSFLQGGRRGMFLKLQTQQGNSWLILPSSTPISPNCLWANKVCCPKPH